MAYERTVWRDHIVARPRTYTMVQNEDGTVTLTPAYGAVSQQGTPVNAANLNKLEAAAEDLDGRMTTMEGKIVRCTAQGTGMLTFTAASTPAANMTVNIIILKQ